MYIKSKLPSIHALIKKDGKLKQKNVKRLAKEHIFVYACIHTYMYVYTYMHICIFVYLYIQMYKYTHIHIHIYINIYV